MDRPKRKHIHYITGIISLTILPIAFILFANKEIKQRTITVLPIILEDKNLPKKFPEIFKNISFPQKRKYIEINLTGDSKKDKTKLDFAQIRIGEILLQNDTVNGIHFKFGDNSQYWTFIRAIDILRFENAKTYMEVDNDLWFYHFPNDTTLRNWICGTTTNIVNIDTKISWRTNEIKWTISIWNSSWPIISAYTAFLFLIFILRRQKKGK